MAEEPSRRAAQAGQSQESAERRRSSPVDTDQDHRGRADRGVLYRKVLAPALWHREIYLTPIILGVPGHKGGNVNYARVKKDVLLHLRQDPTAYCSTMLDLYGLGDGFPGVPPPPHLTGVQKALPAKGRSIRTSLLPPRNAGGCPVLSLPAGA